MPDNRPRSRQKNLTSGGGNVYRRGSGAGFGSGGNRSGGRRSAAVGGRISLPVIIIAVLYMLLNGHLPTGTDSGTDTFSNPQTVFSEESNKNYQVNTSVAGGSRAKRTVLKGNGEDEITFMIYMCGTDLESRSGMASNDLAEMAAATLGENMNLIVYTGGCTKWRTGGISNHTNQIYQVKKGDLKCLVKNAGEKPMTDPNTLSGFIKWCAKEFPANRNELILWDHGGGSVSGYGYDEKYKRKGSMSLSGIKKALQAGGVDFDIIGFDACLMATAETALMLDDFGDYLLASEETEPGIGWYYTNWLSKLGKNTSMSTLELGKNVIDDYTNACAAKCPGQKTTLSLIDLAEFANTVPPEFKKFSKSLNSLIVNKNYKKVSNARYQTREFAASSQIDQVDLVHLSQNLNTSEGRSLAAVLKEAVKYNRTSSNMTNANGVSIYFPYRRTSYVDTACSTYNEIGIDKEYSKCIREFAGMETSGQVAAGGSTNPLGSLLGSALSGGTSSSSEVIGQLLSSFLKQRNHIDELDKSNTGYYDELELSSKKAGSYIAKNHLDAKKLVWKKNSDGKYLLKLSEKQWELVHDIDLNMFYDDGEGFVDLGLDNMFEYDKDGNMIADTSGTWLAINGQVVPYYHLDTTEEGGDSYTITGRVPVLLNGQRTDLILVFTDEKPEGFIAGATTDYADGETDTIAKNMTELKKGDTLDFVCDYYSYNGDFQDTYLMGEQLTVSGKMKISDVPVGSGEKKITYRLTDIYNQEYFMPTIR